MHASDIDKVVELFKGLRRVVRNPRNGYPSCGKGGESVPCRLLLTITRCAGPVVAVLATLVFALFSAVEGATTTREDAALAMRGWQKVSPRPLGKALGTVVRDVRTYNDKRGEPLYHVVSLLPSGFVVVPADDELDPILAFAPTGSYDPSLDNPLVALITGDLTARRKLLSRKTQQPQEVMKSTQAKTKWSLLVGMSTEITSTSSALAQGVKSISNEWVTPFVASQWGQSFEIDQNAPDGTSACYNYYTPPYEAGDVDNYRCGCTATAIAQLMRYYEYPTTPVGTVSYVIWEGVDLLSLRLQWEPLRGGDGTGGKYSWELMPLLPVNCSNEQRRAIGCLTHDVGVAAGASYREDITGAGLDPAVNNLVSVFHYTNAVYQSCPVFGFGTNDLYRILNPNLDALCPEAHRVRHGTLHSAAEHDAALQLLGDGLGHQIGIEFRLTDFFDADMRRHLHEGRDLLAQ